MGILPISKCGLEAHDSHRSSGCLNHELGEALRLICSLDASLASSLCVEASIGSDGHLAHLKVRAGSPQLPWGTH